MAESSSASEILSTVSSVLGAVNDGIQSLYTGDSRGLCKDYDIGFVVPTPAWFPDSLVRSIQKSLYTKMLNSSMYEDASKIESGKNTLDFYNESTAGFFGSMWNNAVNSIVSTAANQIASVTGKVDSAINTVSSFFSDDEKESLASIIAKNNSNRFMSEQPYVVVKGIHMQEYGSQKIVLLQKMIPLIKSAYNKLSDKISKDAPLESKAKDILNSSEEVLKKIIASYYAPKTKTEEWKNYSFMTIVSELLSEDMRLHGPAESFLSEVAMGQYKMLCKLPYIGVQSPMMQSTGEHGWKGSIVTGGGPFDAIGDMLGMNIAWNSPVTWSTANMEQFTPLRSSFTIFNDTFEHFITNYAFIIQFMATTKAVTDFLFVRSPYLYDVEIPGGVRYQLCTCTASITHVGKTRKLFNDSKGGSVTKMMNSLFGVNLNPVAIQYVPDAYSVNLEFRSLLPDLWNFADSYISGLTGRESGTSGESSYSSIGSGGYLIGDEIGTKLTSFVDKVADAIK